MEYGFKERSMIRYLIGLFCCLLTIFSFAEEEELQEELILSTPDQLVTLPPKNDP